MEFVVLIEMRIFIPLQTSRAAEFQEFVPKHAFTRYVVKRRNSSVKRTPLLREEVGRAVAGPAKIDEEIHSLSDALIASEEGLGR